MHLQKLSKGTKTFCGRTGHFGPVNGRGQEMEKRGIEWVWGSKGLDIPAQSLGGLTIKVASLAEVCAFHIDHFELVAVQADGTTVVFSLPARFANLLADEKRRAHLPASCTGHLDSSRLFLA
jgi:hypothetical protein